MDAPEIPHGILVLPYSRHSELNSTKVQNAIVLYKSGLSTKQVGTRLGIPKTSVRSILLKAKVPLRPSLWTTEGKATRQKRSMAGNPPYGYAYLDGRLHIHPTEIQVVRRILNLRHSGMSFSSIACNLNDLEIKTRSGKTWDHSVISEVCRRNLPTDPKELERRTK